MPKLPPAGFVFTVSLTLYWLTTPADLTTAFYGADGGELITAAVTLGIPHPPGYPTYVLLGHLLSYWPWGIVAYRFNLWSGLCMAAAAALLTHGQPRPAVLPGFLFATLPLVWQTALIAEVYALNLLVIAIGFYLLRTRPHNSPAAFWFGLAVTTHLTSLFLLPLLLLNLRPGQWKAAGFYYLLGLTPFLLLFPLAHTNSPVQWGNATTPAGWLWLVTGQLYWPNSFGLNHDQFSGRLTTWLPLLLYHILYLTALPICSYFLLFFFRYRNRCRFFKSFFLLPLPFFATITLYLLYAFGYAQDDALVFTLPAFYLLGLISPRPIFPPEKRKYALLFPFIFSLFLFIFHISYFIFPISHPPRTQFQTLRPHIPDHALLISTGRDLTLYPLWYFHHVEGQGENWDMIDSDLLAFAWYRHHLQQQNPELKGLTEDNLPRLIEENQQTRPVCLINLPHQTLTCPYSPPVERCPVGTGWLRVE